MNLKATLPAPPEGYASILLTIADEMRQPQDGSRFHDPMLYVSARIRTLLPTMNDEQVAHYARNIVAGL